MKGRKIVPIEIWQKAVSLSLALVLIFSIALQAAHDHSNYTSGDPAGDHSYFQTLENCAICDYLASDQGKQAYLSHSLAAASPARPESSLFIAYISIYKSTLQGFINKGPPHTARQAA